MLVHAALLALFCCWVSVHSNPAPGTPPPVGAAGVPKPQGPDPYDVLVKWLRANGAKFPQLSVERVTDDYRQVNSMGLIRKDVVILEVPHRLLMTTVLAKASGIGQELSARSCEVRSSHTWLACMLLDERANKTSFWSPYINTLPRDYNHMPIHFEEIELDALRGSLTIDKIYAQAEELLLEYDNLCHCYPAFAARFERDDFIWARLAVLTRIFGFEVNGVAGDGLVPMADMLNHKRPRETAWGFDDTRQAFTITSLQEITDGSEVYDSYGPKCNSRFFVNYGFALEHNDENMAIITLELNPSDPLYWIKLRFLDTQTAQSPAKGMKKFTVTAFMSDANVKQMLSYARYIVADAHDFRELTLLDTFNIETFEPITIQNEMAAIQLISMAAKAAQLQFNGTIADDNRLLAEHKASLLPGGNPAHRLSDNGRVCIVVRRGEKLVLQSFIELAVKIPSLLMMKPSLIAAHLPTFLELDPQYSDYITTAIVPLGRAALMRMAMSASRHAASQCRLSQLTRWPAPDQLHPVCPHPLSLLHM